MTDGPNEGFAFIVDTNDYAGNFEREMTAYVTGHVGDCEVGDDLIEDLPVNFDNVMEVPDDNGTYRPTSCWEEPTSGQNNAVAMFFDSKPTDEQVEFMKDRVNKFPEVFSTKGRMAEFNKDKPLIKILGFRLIEFKSSVEEITL